jgi:hypothetical protein
LIDILLKMFVLRVSSVLKSSLLSSFLSLICSEFTDLDEGFSGMIIFETNLTTFEANLIFKGAGEVPKIGFILTHHRQIYHAQICESHCPKYVKS